MRKSAPKTVKVLLSTGYSTNPSDSVNLRRNSDGVKLMGVQIPLSIIAMPLRRAYALPGAIFLVSA